MFQVDGLQFGRISWYYELVSGKLPLIDTGYPPFTPLDLGTRWILENANWKMDLPVVGFCDSEDVFKTYLTDNDIAVVSPDNIPEGGLSGAYLIGGADFTWQLVSKNSLGDICGAIEDSGNFLFVIYMSFASNHGLPRVRDVTKIEKEMLTASSEQFLTVCKEKPDEMICESPALLARWILDRLQASGEYSLEQLTTECFVFEPDVMTSPVGERVLDIDSARDLQKGDGEVTNRRGVLLISLSREK